MLKEPMTFLETLADKLKNKTLDMSGVTPRDLLMLQCHLLKHKQYAYAKQIGNYAKVRAPFTGKLPLDTAEQPSDVS